MRVRAHTLDKFARGVAFFAFGMAKKILIANPMGHVADTAFAAGTLHAPDAWFGLLGYAFQIYFDFSGYSDMACGLALMLGFVLIQNFDSPYQADSITDFWRRWHISLSTWLRDYLYIPLGGNRLGEPRTYVNLMVVMLLGGLWHGASWNFVLWGAIHGGMLAFERAQGQAGASTVGCPLTLRDRDHLLRRLPLLGVLPREDARAGAGDVQVAVRLRRGDGGVGRSRGSDVHAASRHGVRRSRRSCVWRAPNTWTFTSRLSAPRALAALGLLALSILMMWTQSANPFLYFQF